MTHDLTNGQKLGMLIASKLKDQQLTESQKADMQGGASGDYEPESLFEAMGEVDDMLQQGDIKGLISLYRKLPSLPVDVGIVKVRTMGGKVLPYLKWLGLVEDKFPTIPEGLKIKKVIGPKGLNKLYLNMYWEEFTKTIYGSSITVGGHLAKASVLGIKIIYNTLIRDKYLRPATRYSLEWAQRQLSPPLENYFSPLPTIRPQLVAMIGNLILDDEGLEALKGTRSRHGNT